MKKAGERVLGIGITMVVCCAVEIVNLHFSSICLNLR